MGTVVVSATRPGAQPIEDIRAILGVWKDPENLSLTDEAALDLVHNVDRRWTGGAIFPFEYEVVRACGQATTIAEVETLIAGIADHEHYKFPFAPGDKVVSLAKDGDPAPFGTRLTVDTCYVGQSWSGEECYVRFVGVGTPKADGTGAGYGYASFMLADEYDCIREARAGGGYLDRLLGSESWSRPQGPNGEVDPEASHGFTPVIERLIAKNVLRPAAYDNRGTTKPLKLVKVSLVETAPQIARAGFALTPQEQVEQALRRAMITSSQLLTKPYVDFKGGDGKLVGLDGLFNIETWAKAVCEELGL